MADDNKIAFILYQQEKADLSVCMESLRQIHCPEGYKLEVVTSDACASRGESYQTGMESSDAKYKIYLDTQTWLLHEKMLTEAIDVFLRNPQIGILGVAGTEIVPTNGLFWKSSKRLGRLSNRAGKQQILGTFKEAFREVQVLDGCFLMTQYDIPWRNDLFEDNRFLCAAQAIEFQRKGYKACVIHQDYPWLVCHAQGEEYDAVACERLLDEYSKDLFPLVSVVIPTYCRPDYFKVALDSVLAQTYRNLDIFITDNSPDDRTEDLMQSYLEKDSRIHYEHHKDYDAVGNWNVARQYNNPKAEYVNWLMDDDVFLPEKIARMIEYYLFYPDIALVTSYRQMIDAEGRNLSDAPWTVPIVSKTSRLPGRKIGKEVLLHMFNCIGEPTTVLIKKKLMKNGDLGWTGEEGRYFLSDVPTWLNLLEQGDMIYIREPLSLFRQHSGQGQCSFSVMCGGQVCWALEIQYAWEKKIYIETEQELEPLILQWAHGAIFILKQVTDKKLTLTKEEEKDRVVLEKVTVKMLEALYNGYVLNFSIEGTSVKDKY